MIRFKGHINKTHATELESENMSVQFESRLVF
jgi:hypothetical protein